MAFAQLNIPVRDMEATLAFYRRLGIAFDAEPGAFHVAAELENGLLIEFDTTDFVHEWDTGYDGSRGGSVVLGFRYETRQEVDALYADLTAAGYAGRQPPYDAFWGARYAIAQDPDGNPVGLMSPIDESAKFWPPNEPPHRASS